MLTSRDEYFSNCFDPLNLVRQLASLGSSAWWYYFTR